MASKKEAEKEARELRKKYGKTKTLNVVEITKGNWGVRFSAKGKRDRFKKQFTVRN